MKISIIIPTYKPKEYIYDCLSSLVKQTLPYEDFEVLLVLNGCKEPYQNNIKKYVETEMRNMNIRLLQTDIAGVSNARNLALDVMRGDFVTFIDDDDYVSPCYLEELYKVAVPNVISLSYAIAFKDPSNLKLPYSITTEYDEKSLLGIQPYYKVRKFFSGAWMKLIHRSIIGDRRFDIRFRNGEDSLFMFLISDKMSYVNFASKNAIYYRRYRVNSAMTVHRSLWMRVKTSFDMICSYSKIYFSDTVHYNFSFYLTRILGSIKSIFNVVRIS